MRGIRRWDPDRLRAAGVGAASRPGPRHHGRPYPLGPVAPDARGTVHDVRCRPEGRGANGDTEPYSIEREYEDIAAVVRSVPGPVNLLGHSCGALICLENALRVGNLRRLVLYEPGFPVMGPLDPPGLRERYRAMLESGDREGMMLAFYAKWSA